jgi:hypothetical protein
MSTQAIFQDEIKQKQPVLACPIGQYQSEFSPDGSV